MGYGLKRMWTRFSVCMCLVFFVFSSFGCANSVPNLPEYKAAEFATYGFYSPYEITEESFLQYKNAGFNTLLVGNDVPYLLGSDSLMEQMELCRQTGLKIIPNGMWWHYSNNKFFTEYDLYEEYKDIIRGMHICDEPKKIHLEEIIFNTELVENFKSVYSDKWYYVNLFATYGTTATGYDSYSEYLDAYYSYLNEADFENKFVSLDFYPFQTYGETQNDWLICYDLFAKKAKENDVKETACYIATCEGGELRLDIGEGEILQQINVGLCYGMQNFGYYCYSVPHSKALVGQRFYDDEGNEYMYRNTMLDWKNKPTNVYYYVQSANDWLADIANAYKAYSWTETFAVHSENDQGSPLDSISDKIPSGRKIKKVTASENAIVGCFDGENGEAYMLCNMVDPMYDTSSDVTLTFDGCKYVAVYERGKEPRVEKLHGGAFSVTLSAGEGVFVVPLS